MHLLKKVRVFTSHKRRFRLFTCVLVFGVFFIFGSNFLLPTTFMQPTMKRKISAQSGIRLDLRLGDYLDRDNRTVPFDEHYFDSKASNKIPPDRELLDTRNQMCYDQEYSVVKHHKTSVVISFFNEARSTLLRTVISILKRTPVDLLEEIILVDDFSDVEDDVSFFKDFQAVRVIRNKKREGLIRSRNRGAQEAFGEYIFFIDSHCEVNVGWLEPLLSRIAHNQGVLASPIIDVINPNTFQYKASSSRLKGGFDWSLAFKWIPMTEEERESRPDDYLPFLSPSTSGGIFLISKSWFKMLGGFDVGLNTWGGESLEMSVKAWLCGGQVEIVPCSRVGHIFRKKHPFEFPNGATFTKLRNSKRIAEVWFDEFKNFFYSVQPEARYVDAGEDLLEIGKTRELLQCRHFSWYLQNVFPELRPPNDNHLAFGELKQGEKCLVITSKGVHMDKCFESQDLTKWVLDRESGVLSTEKGGCLNVQGTTDIVIEYCKKQNDTQRWRRTGGTLIHNVSGRCLESLVENSVGMSLCRQGAPSQLWNFSVEFEIL